MRSSAIRRSGVIEVMAVRLKPWLGTRRGRPSKETLFDRPGCQRHAGQERSGSVWATRRLAWIYLALPPMFWGSNFIVGEALHEEIDPLSLNYLRWLIASIFLLPIGWSALRRCWRSIAARWPWTLALSLLGVVSFNTLVYSALSMTTSAQSALIHAATPFVTMVLAMQLIGERFCRRLLAGSLLSFGGAVLVITGGVLSLSFNCGDGLILVTVVIWALFTVMLKRRPPEVPALALLSVVVLIGVIIQTPLYFIFGDSVLDLVDQAPETLVGALYLGVVASVIAYWLWDQGIAAVGPAAASQYFHLVPLSASIMAWSLLGEPLSIQHVIGAGLVLVGLVIGKGDTHVVRSSSHH